MILGLDNPPSVISTSNSVEFLRSMIDRQLGVGFQTAMGIEASLKRGLLVQVPLQDTEPVRQRLSLCVSSGILHSAAFRMLLTLLETRLSGYADEWS
jgi:DNA-binding transcriptional LysR family regulator